MIPNPHNNASLIMGGFGTVAEGAKPFIEEMRTNQDFDLLSQQAMQLMEQGVSPQEAAARLKGGGAPPQGQPAPGGQRPGLVAPTVPVGTPQQPNIVGRVVGPSSPMQDRPQPPIAAQAAPPDPALLSRPSGPSILGSPLEMNDPGYAPPQAPPRQPLRPPAQPAPAPAPVAQVQQSQAQGSQLYGVQGRITSRNLPLAQLMSQRLQQRDLANAKQQGASEALNLKANLDREKMTSRENIAVLNAQTRANIAGAGIDKALQVAQLTKDTDVFEALLRHQDMEAAIAERAARGDQQAQVAWARLQQNAPLLKATTQMYAALAKLKGTPFFEKSDQEEFDTVRGILTGLGESGLYEAQVTVKPGEETTTTQPGPIPGLPEVGASTKTERGPAQIRVGPGAGQSSVSAGASSKGPASKPAGPPAPKTVVRTGTNKVTGKKVIVYSDGTREER